MSNFATLCRRALFLEESARELLTPEEIAEIERQGIKFAVPQPEDADNTFFIENPDYDPTVRATKSIYQAITKPQDGKVPLHFCYTRRMVEVLRARREDVVKDLNDTLSQMERGMRDNIWCR